MTLHPLVMVVMAIWFGGAGIVCLVLLSTISSIKSFQPMILMPFGILVLAYALVMDGFKSESTGPKKYLARLFEAKIEE